uniref:Uncharacterized protein LOC111128201 n=1 Tax=Crassostrea virginica TaxID=6565 RepID=A0A8B8DP97_CRAVI|nr:uncharacterized protein LOC111128201 [Crassostrea virginica]
MPRDVRDIPTPEVARSFSHLRHIDTELPEYDPNIPIGLLIGRDLLEAHHIEKQIVGPKDSPFAQKIGLGWVIVGDVCLDKRHPPDFEPVEITSFKTSIIQENKVSIFKPCSSNIKITDSSYYDRHIFDRRADDDEVGLSTEDHQFLSLMSKKMVHDGGKWTAPLPFRENRPTLPNNFPIAEKRAKILDKSLRRDPVKRDHFVQFMSKVLNNKAAEVAPTLPVDKEVWYLPIFGVYNPKKMDQIRGVFDSSAEYQGVSLNRVLLSGPNLTNSLLGILLRFRKNAIAVSADIEQMFYSFLVSPEHRDYLRFLWYQDNDPNKELIQYRMKAHVFGNSPSPAVATYGLRKCIDGADEDVQKYVCENCYVDDGLMSLDSTKEAVGLLKKTQEVLRKQGNLRLHKIVSNSPDVMATFKKEDLDKEMKSLDLDKDNLPVHTSLGLSWDLSSDVFIFNINFREKPDTRRGYLSMLHSALTLWDLLHLFWYRGKSFYVI